MTTKEADGHPRTGGIPWLRFLGEGVVIIASILLAFAIDAWWGGRQEARIAAEYLSALEAEFEAARFEMEQQIGEHTRQLAAIDSLLSGLARGETGGRLWRWVDDLSGVYVYGPYHPVFQDLANAGGPDLLTSPELRLALLRYGQSRDFLAVISARELQLWEDLMQPFLLENTDAALHTGESPVAPRFPSGGEALTRSRYFQNLLIRRRGLILSQLGLDRDVLDAIHEVLRRIGGDG